MFQVVFDILNTKFWLSLFFYATSTSFVYLHFEAGSDENTLEINKEVSISETKINHVNIKATRVYIVKKNILLPLCLKAKY